MRLGRISGIVTLMINDSLDVLRQAITVVDTQIVHLLGERAAISRKIGAHKEDNGIAVYDPAREFQLFDRLEAELGDAPLTPEALRSIYREIISASIQLQRPVTIAYLGPTGTHSEEAARKLFGSQATLMSLNSPEEINKAVERGSTADGADYGVLPIENSTHGAVLPVLDALADSSLTISTEIVLPIHHYLMGKGSLEGVKTVYSHEQALAQCHEWLARHLPKAELVPVRSTAHAAALAANEPDTAAIAPKQAAHHYDLNLFAECIEDRGNNSTRFVAVGREIAPTKPSGMDKTSITFLVTDKPGSLISALEMFRRHGVNLTMIQSRPANAAWQYRFFLDCRGHVTDLMVQAALKELQGQTASYRVMGSYPVGK